MNVRLTGSTLWLLMLLAFFESWTPAAAQSDPTRTPLPAHSLMSSPFRTSRQSLPEPMPATPIIDLAP